MCLVMLRKCFGIPTCKRNSSSSAHMQALMLNGDDQVFNWNLICFTQLQQLCIWVVFQFLFTVGLVSTKLVVAVVLLLDFDVPTKCGKLRLHLNTTVMRSSESAALGWVHLSGSLDRTPMWWCWRACR